MLLGWAFVQRGNRAKMPAMTDRPAETCEIRPAGLADAPALCAFKRQVFAETEFLLQGAEDFDDQVELERELIGRFHHQQNSVLVLAVVPDGRVVGLCSIVGGHLWRTRHVGTMSVGVLRAWWRRGLGRRMMLRTIRWAEENPLLEKLTLQVHATNTAARAMYFSFGFRPEGLLRGEAKLGSGEDDLVPMARWLRNVRAADPGAGTPAGETP